MSGRPPADGRDPFGPVDPDQPADPDVRSNPFDPRRPDAIRPRRPDADDAPLPGSIAPPGSAAPRSGPAVPPAPASGRSTPPPSVWAAPPGRPDPFAPREQIPERSLTPGRRDPLAPRPQDASRPPPPDEPVSLRKRLPDREEATASLKKVGGPAGLAALLVWKVGRIALVALGKVAILFKIPLLGSVISGLISIGAYAVFFGWGFAIGLVLSLLVHELGHVFQIRREGLPVKALNFVPFLGAYVQSEGIRSDDQQARISIAGPIAGALLAVVVFFVAGDDPLLRAVAYTGFYLNLFNLLPIPMLDGGGVGRVFPPVWWIGIASVLGAVALASGQEFAWMASLAAVIMAYVRRADGWDVEPGDGVPIPERVKAAALYVAVIAVCSFGMEASFKDRTSELVDTYGHQPAVVAQHHER